MSGVFDYFERISQTVRYELSSFVRITSFLILFHVDVQVSKMLHVHVIFLVCILFSHKYPIEGIRLAALLTY